MWLSSAGLVRIGVECAPGQIPALGCFVETLTWFPEEIGDEETGAKSSLSLMISCLNLLEASSPSV